MNKPKVFITGGDGIGWAVDEDLRLVRQAMEPLVEFSELTECEAVHAMWWQGLLMWPDSALTGKRIICHVPGEPFRYFTVPEHGKAMSVVGAWITRTVQAQNQLKSLGTPSRLIPYLVDVETFKPLESRQVQTFRDKWNIPSDRYLIASFQRDTEGSDLSSPKLVKGPDILLEILRSLKERNTNVHALLAGPRRHWILKRLEEFGIPFTYVGVETSGDDIDSNTLPRETLNILYNIADLYVVASRSEGGPHAILEAAASGCKILSTRVGTAPDILEPDCIFTTPADAVDTILRDMETNRLEKSTQIHLTRIIDNHRPESVTHKFDEMYKRLNEIPVYTGAEQRSHRPEVPARSKKAGSGKITVGLWHSFFKPPYGGGNQFMLGLKKALLKRSIDVRVNELHDDIDAYVLNSIHFDVDAFLEFSRNHRLNIVHRIDGPIHLIRGFDREKDDLCYDLNARFAAATVIQSAWTFQRIVEMGYNPVNAVIIRNGVDSDIFHSRGRIPFDGNRKVRLIASSWSNNPRKGGPVYKWIEDNLDWERFDFTFVGNVSEELKRAKHIPAVPSEELADILRNHDIYITASRNDPCSNALIEAMACGLPALYLNDGGHPELVGSGGLPFTECEEIPAQLDRLTADYASFQRLIAVNNIDDVAEKYLALIRNIIK